MTMTIDQVTIAWCVLTFIVAFVGFIGACWSYHVGWMNGYSERDNEGKSSL